MNILAESTRNTIQKQVILSTLQSMKTHPSVDELYTEVQKKHPAISKATVYRNIKQLTSKGVVAQVGVVNDACRYDGCVDFHHHFICNTCSGVFDMSIKDLEDVAEYSDKIHSIYGHAMEKRVTLFFGQCANCVVG